MNNTDIEKHHDHEWLKFTGLHTLTWAFIMASFETNFARIIRHNKIAQIQYAN